MKIHFLPRRPQGLKGGVKLLGSWDPVIPQDQPLSEALNFHSGQ